MKFQKKDFLRVSRNYHGIKLNTQILIVVTRLNINKKDYIVTDVFHYGILEHLRKFMKRLMKEVII